jgi:hypothetical protein
MDAMKATAVLVTAVAAMFLSAAGVSAQTIPPPTLSGETLTGTTTTATTTGCNPDGTSTFTYQTTGVATGPFYNGTFTETGTVTLGPQPIPPGTFSAPGGIVTSWTATFTITSTAPIAATITGTKTLLPPPPGFSADVSGTCENGTRGVPPGPNFPPQTSANDLVAHELLGYTATITLADGSQFRDSGTSRAFESTLAAAPELNSFSESYTSNQTATIPLCNQNDQGNQDQNGNDQGCVNP